MSPSYTLLTSEAEYRQACDTILARTEREILIFDRDLAALQLEETPRLEALSRFIQMGSLCRIRVVVHDPELLARQSTRLMQLLVRFSHRVDLRQSPDNLRHLADTHMLADKEHGVRRFHVDQPRGALILDDPASVNPWRQRFEELWNLSHPCLRVNTTGL